MADLMKDPTEWRKKEVERLSLTNTLRKQWIEVERRKAEALVYTHNFKMQHR